MSDNPGQAQDGLAARVAELERTVASLQRRVAELGGAGADDTGTGGLPPNTPAANTSNAVAARGTGADTTTANEPGAAAAPGVTATAPQPAPTPSATPTPRPISPQGPTPYAPYPLIPDTTPRPSILFASGGDPGQWINRLGIVLVLLGTAFGFKYSIERGWIGPAVRVACGLGLSALLVLASTALHARRSGLSRMLGGGGIACAYLSIYAAFQLYALVGLSTAFVAMSAITAVAFVLAHRDDDAGMATLGAIGGLATPFLLYTGGRDVTGLVVYTGLVVSASSVVFLSRGWRVLLSATTFGAWAILTSLATQLHFHDGISADAAVVQGGILFVALATWWLAVMRELMAIEEPGTWRPSRLGIGDSHDVVLRFGDPGWAQQTRELTLLTPIAVLLLSSWAWNVDQGAAGWIALSLAAGWAGGALHLRRLGDPGRVLSASHAAGAAVMVAFATALLLGDDARRFGLAAEALALLMAARAGDGRAARLGHLLFLVVSVETLARMRDATDSITFRFGATELSELAVVALLFAASRVSPPARRNLYFVVAQGGWMLWLKTMLDPLPHGAALTTSAWFASAVLMIAAGLFARSPAVRRGGAGVMTFTMAKLFLLDMASIDGLWRIATFLGFGAVLLGLGYAFPALWSPSEDERDPQGRPSDDGD